VCVCVCGVCVGCVCVCGVCVCGVCVGVVCGVCVCVCLIFHRVFHCFSTAGPRSGAGLWHQLY